ncbi:MAG: T9SS type A sorting domain-containing protein [Pirellulales bacterium]|nr:T9SS type A sorting domain-containing protein [Pirellulales bacterium]
MNKTILIIIFITLYSYTFSQNYKWEIHIGTSNRNETAEYLIEDYDKGYYIVGGIDGEKGWNIKTDVNGTILYDKELEHDIYDIDVWGVTTDINGNKYICGPKFVNTTWPYVVKLDSCGGLLWCKLLDNELFEFGGAFDILINKNEEIIVLCWYYSEPENDRIHLIGLNENGDVLWKNPYASRNNYSWIRNAYPYDLLESNGDYYISGYCYWPYPDDTTHFYLRPLFIGIDSLFNEKWILPFYALDSIFGQAFSCITINDSEIMGVGMRRLEDPEESGLLMFFDNLGNELGYKEITKELIGPDISQVYFVDIERINDSLFIVASPVGINNEYAPHGEIIIDTAANIYNLAIRYQAIGTQKILKTFDNNFVISGEIEEDENKSDSDILLYKINENLESVPFDTNTYTYDSLCPYQIQSGIIDLTDCLIVTDVGEAPTPQQYYEGLKRIPIKAYPNPASNKITFAFENTEHHKNIKLQCFDIYGRKVHKEKVYHYQGESKVDVSRWFNGLYVAIVLSEGKVVGRKKFVVK